MRIKIFFLFLFIYASSIGQSVVFTNPDLFSICQSAEFTFELVNDENQSLQDVSLRFTLPCGLEYVAGSANGLAEENTSDLTQPEFTLSEIPPNASLIFYLELFAPCTIQECIDLGTVFQNELNITFSNDSKNYQSDPYIVESVLPLIKKVDQSFITGNKNSTVKRYISIQNTRPGFLTSFTYFDKHEEGIFISSTQGNNSYPSNETFQTILEGGDFSQIGNGDDFFDFNETIIIEECIDILTCNYIDLNIISELSLEWGCQDNICTNEIPSQNALIRVLNFNEEGPILEFSEEKSAPLCACENEPYTQKIIIENTSDLYDAVNINLLIKNTEDLTEFYKTPFKLVRSGGFEELNPTGSNSMISDCFPDEFNKSMSVVIGRISKNELVTLEWSARYCNTNMCPNPNINWEYNYGYEKECADLEDILHSGSGRSPVEPLVALNSRLSDATTFNPGDTETLEYTILSPLLETENGTANITINLPCLLGLEDTDWEIDGTLPLSQSIEFDSIETSINLSYALPFTADSIILDIPVLFQCFEACNNVPCLDSIITTCSEICEIETQEFSVFAKTSFDILDNCPLSCLPSACSSRKYGYNCEQEICEIDMPGYLDYDFTFERLNSGLPDNDDNHQPDSSGELDEDKIRRDNAVTGDTLRFDFSGTVIADIPNSKFDDGLLDLVFRYAGAAGISRLLISREVPKLLSEETGLKRVFLEFSIYDKSRDEFYYCSELSNPNSNPYEFDISPASIAANNCIPLDFKYEDGDIISLKIDYVINHNFESNKTEYGLLLFDVDLEATLVPEDFGIDEAIVCGCPRTRIRIANYKTFISQTTDFLNVCNEQNDSTGTSKLAVLGHIANHFPFEYKPSVIGEKIQFPQPKGSFLKFIELRNLRTNETTLINPVDPSQYLEFDYDRLTPSLIEIQNAADIVGFYEIDINKFEGIEWDENVQFTIYIQYDTDACEFFGSNNYTGNMFLEYAETIEKLALTENDIEFKAGLIGKDPIISMNVQPCDNSSLSEEVIWNLTIDTDIKNDFENENALIYKWIYPEVKNQSITDFKLINLDTGEEYPIVNGVFNVPDTLREETFALQLTGINNSCDQENIIFHYGWDCIPVTDIDESECEQFEIACTVLSPPGVLDMIVTQTLSTTQLCDTLDWIEIEIFNAGLSQIFDIRLEAYLLPGMEIISNTSQLLLSSNNNYLDIQDPENTSGQIFEWDFDKVDPNIFLDVLPGVNATPQNSFKIRFKAISSCDIIAGAPVSFTAYSLKNCDEPTGNISKISASIEIENIDANYNTIIDAEIESLTPCQDIIDLNLAFELSEQSVLGDSIFLQLPTDIVYVPNSCNGSLTNCEPALINGFLAWEIPPDSETITINISLAGLSAYNCNQLDFPILATSSSNALCVSENTECSIKIATGNSNFKFLNEAPAYSITDFSIVEINESASSLNVSIINKGLENDTPLILDLFIDSNGDELLTQDDELIETFNIDQAFTSGDTIDISINSSNVDIEDLCLLSVAISETNCTCVNDIEALSRPLSVNFQNDLTVCSGEEIQIGNNNLDGTFNWEDSPYIDCLDCPETNFVFNNMGLTPETVILTQTEKSDDDCEISYKYEITINPSPGIFSFDSSICEGDTAQLIASEADSYLWQGPNTQITDQQIVNVSPSQSSQYILEIEDENNCSATDTVFIEVIAQPVVDAGEDISACFGESIQLDGTVNSNDEIIWSPPNIVSDANVANPTLLSQNDNTLYLTVFNGTCLAQDSVQVEFFSALDIELEGEVNICEGEDISLLASGAQNYNWSPSFFDMCQNSECDRVNFTPESSVNMTVIGEDAEGCIDTLKFEVIVNATSSSTTEIIECAGESVEIFGTERTEAGIYCDSIFVNNCPQVNCIELSFYSEQTLGVNPEIKSILEGEEIQLTATEGFAEYNWENSSTLSCDDCPNPIAAPAETTNYFLSVIDRNGCVYETEVLVEVRANCRIGDIGIPSAFTANNNGKNDFFRISNLVEGLENIEVEVFNRWGESVYRAFDNSGWDGTYKGELAPEGVYVYIIKIACTNDVEEVFKGNLTLLR